MSKNALTLHAHINGIVARHGGLRPAARALGMTAPYLYRLYTGDKDNPSARTLRRLGLKRVVLYVANLDGRDSHKTSGDEPGPL